MKSDGNGKKTELANNIPEVREDKSEFETGTTNDRYLYQQLRDSEEKYRSLFELSPIGIVILDTKGVIQSCNDAVYELSGYSEEELVGKHFSEITPLRAKDIPKFLKIFASAITGKTSKPYEVEYIRKDGTQGWTEIQLAALKSNGSITGIQVLQRDVTGQKNAKKTRLENEQRYRALFENLSDAALLTDVKTGHIIDANKKAEELLKRPREEIIGIHLTELHPSELDDEYHRRLTDLIEKGHAFEHEGKIITASGTAVPMRISATPISINGEQFILGLFSDITERLKTEGALRESEEIFRVLFDNSADLLSLWDFNGNIIRVNETWTKTLGYTPETFGDPSEKIHPEDRDRVIKHVKVVLNGNASSESIRYRHMTASGRYIHLDTIEKNIQVAGRKLRLVSSRDITEQNRIEEALQESEEFNNSLLENQPHQINVINPDGSIRYVNPAFREANGWTLDELVGMRPPFPWWPPENIDDQLNGFKKAISDGKGRGEVLTLKKNGELYWLDIAWTPVNRNGKLDYLLVNGVDITERKKAEEALKESEEFRSRLLNLSPNPILVLNPDTSIMYVNPALEKLTGFTSEELTGQKIPHPWWRKERWEEARKLAFESIKEGRGATEVLFKKKNGEDFWVETNSTQVTLDGKLQYVLITWNDITERKRAEIALKESEDIRLKILDVSPNPIMVINQDGINMYINPAFEKLTGFKAEEVIGKKPPNPWWRESVVEEAIEQAMKDLRVKKKDQEVLFKKKDGEKFWVSSSSTPVRKDGELQFTLITWNDITERKQAEEEIKLRAELLDNSGDAIMLHDFYANILYVNKKFCEAYGYKEEELIGKNIRELNIREYSVLFESRLEELKQKGEVLYEFSKLLKDGSIMDVEVFSRIITSKNNKLVLNAERDITERKRAVEKHETILKTALDGFCIIDLNGRFLEVNDSYCQMVNYSRNDLLKMSLQDIEAARNPEEIVSHIEKTVKNNYDRYETRLKCQDGSIIDVEISENYLEIGNGQIFVFLRDITERKRTEIALKESEEFRSKMLDISPNPIFVMNPDTTVRYANQAFERLTGFSLSELKNVKAPHPWWSEHAKKHVEEIIDESLYDIRNRLEVLFRKKNGKKFWVEVSSSPVKIDNELQYVLFNWNDITDRKKAEEELLLRAKLLDNVGDSISVFDEQRNIVYANERFCQLLGYSRDELIGTNADQVNMPQSDLSSEERLKMVEEKGEVVFETAQQHEDGSVENIEVHALLVESGGMKLFLNTGRDITERKQTEEEMQLRAKLLDNAGDGINVTDLDGKFVYVNEVFCKSHGYSRYELMGMNIRQLVPQIDGKPVEARIEEIISKRETEFETLHVHRDGTQMLMEVHSRIIESRGREFILNVERDITERHKREEEIKKLSAAIEYSPSIVMIMDRDAVIEYVNDKYVELTGYSADEIIGKNMREIDLQPLKEQRKMWRALVRGQDWYYEYLNGKKDGELYYEATSISAIKDKNGEITHFVRVGTDITEKKRTEGDLQRSEQQLRELSNHMRQIREEERKSIARNIHDNLGQSLTALKIDMSWLIKRLTDEQLPLIEKANEMATMIDQNIQTVKKLSSELRPEVLDILGLAAAIEWYADEFSQRTGIKCVLSLGEEDVALEEEYFVDCYRILQEALTNVSRHAGASRVRVNLKQEPDKLIMQIRDNGKGISKKDWDETRSFGLMGMRERANSIGGKLEIKSNPGKGTVIKLTVPMK